MSSAVRGDRAKARTMEDKDISFTLKKEVAADVKISNYFLLTILKVLTPLLTINRKESNRTTHRQKQYSYYFVYSQSI
ncbi:MAG: hypothetical protein AN486_03550 [Anabaena sp. AL93]|nr:MAG: hypothetical protein AN486_03550 [Anabaena sp. AL93]